MNAAQILKQSPEVPGYGGGRWAMYSVHCTWWTSFPPDLGRRGQIPACPHCGSPLMQAPLKKFVKFSRKERDKKGFLNFIAAHSRNRGADTCDKSFSNLEAST